MNILIAGIMQGSLESDGMVNQDYRNIIRAALATHHPHSQIIDPIDLHPNSMTYSEEQASEVLFEMAELAEKADIVIAYLPKASLGTAQEMVRAFDADKPIITISPMKKNWFINAYSTIRFCTLDEFATWLSSVRLEDLR